MKKTLQDLVLLSKRASLRRQRLGILAKDLSSIIGISYSTLKNWETSLPHTPVALAERKWEEALKVPEGWLRNPEIVDDAPVVEAHNDTVDLTDQGLVSVTDEILAIASWLSRRLESARTFDCSLLTALESRRARMFATRYGAWGTHRTSINVIADEHKLTRERIRKIIEPMVQRAIGITFIMPKLDELRHKALSSTPMSVKDFNEKFKHLLGPELCIDDADRFAREIVGYSLANLWEKSLRRSSHAVMPMLGDEETSELAQVVRDAGLQMARNCGASHIKFVTGMVSQKLNRPISIEAVKGCLAAVEGIDWLSDDWFWFGPEKKSFAIEAVKKMLQAAQASLHIEVLHEGLCRSRRQNYDASIETTADIEIPAYIFEEVLNRIPWLKRRSHNYYCLGEKNHQVNVLTENELSVIDCLRNHGGWSTRQNLVQCLVETEIISSPSLQSILGNAPFIRNQEAGIYQLRDLRAD